MVTFSVLSELVDSLLFGAIWGAVFLVQPSSAKNDEERWGELKATPQHMQNNLSDIKNAIAKNDNEKKESIRRACDRIDEKFSECLRDERGK